jgi:NAD(P)-dependent dehydrogenase (short-subunit alcohol dehydrogenase family)
VRVNTICPGATRTGMTADLMEDEHVGALIDATIAQR